MILIIDKPLSVHGKTILHTRSIKIF